MDVRLPDGTILQNVPDGTTKDQLRAKLAANGHDIQKMGLGATSADIPNTPRTGPVDPRDAQRAAELAAPERTFRDDNLLGKAFGTVDAGISLLSSMAGGMVAPAAGFVKSAFNGKDPEQNAGDIAESMQYQPRTGTGAQLAGMAGHALAPLMALPTATLVQGAQAIGSGATALRGLAGANAGAMAAQDAQMAANPGRLRDLVRAPQPTMAGGGAAATAEEALRAQRAANHPVPIKLTRGQQDRSFQQNQFERETAKLPEGEVLRQRYADQNQQMLQNFDAYVDETGAQAGNLRAVGKIVTEAVANKMKQAKSKINAAYDDARAAGDMAQPVSIAEITKYIEENRPAALNAPVLNSVEQSIQKLDPKGTGMVSINDLEELRKMTGRLSQPGTPNSVYGGDIKGLIDKTTEGQGGPAYQQARRMYQNYSNEFKNTGVIDKLMRTKRGTNDRQVVNSEVLDHTIFDGTIEDVRHVRRTLQTAGPEGEQAWRELQGATMNQIKETVAGNSARDTRGNPIVSPDKFNRIVNKLDEDGKLDFIFGKQGAQKVRDLRDTALDVYTSPPGTVNSSNTSSALINALDKIGTVSGGVPVIGHAVKYGIREFKSSALRKKAEAAANPPGGE